MDLIDWGAAQRVGDLIAGSPPYGDLGVAAVELLAHDFARRVAIYSGLAVPKQLPPLEAVDRSSWIEANLRTMRPLMSTLTDRLGESGLRSKGPLRGPMGEISGLVLGAQIGALTGMLSQRVLGQYDLSLLDASVEPRLLLLAPNLAQAAGNQRVDRHELLVWVTIHEITHAVQFAGAPWLREYLGGILRELIEGLHVTFVARSVRGPLARRPKLPDPGELRKLIDRARRGELLRLSVGEDRWLLVERMQAAMSLIEGHAEHTMDVIGAEVLPSLPRLRAAMTRRRENRGLPWRVLERLLGLELKMRQYENGRRFCDAVVKDGGPQALARAWSGPEALPSPSELERPSLWITRMSAVPG